MYYNKSKLEGPRFREGDLVYLLRRNIKTTRPSDKLDHKKFGLFKVKRNIKDISYELHLLPTMRIYPVFHISLLESADPDTPTGPAPEIHPNLQEEIYTVQKVLKVRRHRKTLQWLVKWEGYGNEQNTWEPKENLIDCLEALQEYYLQNPKAQGKDQWDSSPPTEKPSKYHSALYLTTHPSPDRQCSAFPCYQCPEASFEAIDAVAGAVTVGHRPLGLAAGHLLSP
jgi:Chromo (CHRromatin Organisation MOdifier) domain